MSSAPAPSRASPPPAAARAAPAAPPSAVAHPAPTAVSPAMAAPQQPSMFQQMAATAGGVAIGSAVVSIFNIQMHCPSTLQSQYILGSHCRSHDNWRNGW